MPAPRHIPIHTLSDISPEGIGIFVWDRLSDKTAKPYSHRDDYYMLVICFEGSLSIKIDFTEVTCRTNDCLIVSPGQVHRIVSIDARSGIMLAIDPCHLAPPYAEKLERFTLRHNRISLPAALVPDIKRVGETVAAGDYGSAKATIWKDAANLLVGMIASHLPDDTEASRKSARYASITVRLRALLHNETDWTRPASRYADTLHISASYLNEAVKAMTGSSTTAYVRQQMVVRAKRQLAYTDRSVAEIALSLGFPDNAYFSRLFSRLTGISPSTFRRKNRESSN